MRKTGQVLDVLLEENVAVVQPLGGGTESVKIPSDMDCMGIFEVFCGAKETYIDYDTDTMEYIPDTVDAVH